MNELNATFHHDYQEDSKYRFSIIPNDLIRDQSISPNCRWLIIYLCSNASNWKIYAKQIMKHCEAFLGRDQVYAVINEAIEAGYLLRQENVIKGLRRVCYTISSDKKFKKSLPRPENPDAAPPDAADQGTKEVPIDKKEKKEEKSNASSAIASALCDYLMSKIKKQKENFTQKVTHKWIKEGEKLLKLRTPDELKKVIDWVYLDSFWSGVVMSPSNLLKNLDKIEMQMVKKSDPKASKVTQFEENKKLAEAIKDRFEYRNDIDLCTDYIGFNRGPNKYITVSFNANGFRDQVMGNLQHMQLLTEGL